MKNRVPYLQMRNGRPRWEPSPQLRARGFKGQDLKDDAGQWLSEGAAIDTARTLNDTTKGIAVAPSAPRKPQARTCAAVFDALRASPKFAPEGEPRPFSRGNKRRLAERTRRSYLAHLKLLEQWCGDITVKDLTLAQIEDFHNALCDGRGVAMANAIIRTLSIALNYAVKHLHWAAHNECAGLSLPGIEGRLVIWSLEEIETFVAAADWCGREAMGDATILGLCTTQNSGDVITMPVLRQEDGVYHGRRRKTGRDYYTPATQMLEQRLQAMRERRARLWPNVHFHNEVINTATGAPYIAEGSTFRDEHRAVRALASGLIHSIEDAIRALMGQPRMLCNLPFTPMPSIMDKHFQDLRDTGITILMEVTGGDKARIANITGHSLATIDAILEKHYFKRHAALSRDTGAKLDAWYANKGK